jgi:hypothetical protein
MIHHRDTEGTEKNLSVCSRPANRFARYSLCTLCLSGYFFASAVVNAAPQEGLLANGDVFTGELRQIADGRAMFGPSAWSLDEIVRWGNPVMARAQTIVVLADGGQLVTAADWSGGAAVRLDGDAVVALSDTFREVRLPRAVVSGVVFAQRRSAAEREELVERVRGDSDPEPSRENSDDAALLTNKDRISGKLTELGRGSLVIETASGAAKLPLSRVEAIVFGGSRQSSIVSRPSRLAVGLRDGSLVHVNEITAGAKELAIKAASGWEASGGTAHDVVALQPVSGDVVYLSDLEPAGYRHVPYLSIEWPYERDLNVDGKPLMVGGKRYLKGIGMHSASRLTYKLDGKYKRFDASVAIDDSAGRRGSVTFAVYTIRDAKLQEAYKSDIVRGGEAPRRVSIDVTGAQSLTLVVDFADRGDEMDRANWLDARLRKE